MRRIFFFFISLFVLMSIACGVNFSTANIQSATLAKDPDGTEPTTIFAQDDVFYLVAEVANAPDDTRVKAVWTAVEVDGVEPNLVLGEKELVSGGQVNFSMENDKLWPVGQYKVDLYLNDELDRTLEFTVEGDVAAQPPASTPTPLPQPTSTPTPESEPTQTPEAVAGDTLAIVPTQSPTPAGENQPKPEPLPFQPEPYTHPSGAFSIAVPVGWEKINEDDLSMAFGDRQSRVGVVFVNIGRELSNEELLSLVNDTREIIIDSFSENYEVVGEKDALDDKGYYYLAITFDDGSGDADLFYEQHSGVVYIIYFASLRYDELQPTWSEILNSYQLDPQAALAVSPPAQESGPAPTPTEPPAPAQNSLAPTAGQSRLYVFNEYSEELTFTINNKEYKIPTTASLDNPVPIDLPPGKYTYTVSVPGGAVNGEVEMGSDQSWVVGVRGDGAVYNPVQVYP